MALRKDRIETLGDAHAALKAAGFVARPMGTGTLYRKGLLYVRLPAGNRGSYGHHVDNALAETRRTLRADASAITPPPAPVLDLDRVEAAAFTAAPSGDGGVVVDETVAGAGTGAVVAMVPATEGARPKAIVAAVRAILLCGSTPYRRRDLVAAHPGIAGAISTALSIAVKQGLIAREGDCYRNLESWLRSETPVEDVQDAYKLNNLAHEDAIRAIADTLALPPFEAWIVASIDYRRRHVVVGVNVYGLRRGCPRTLPHGERLKGLLAVVDRLVAAQLVTVKGEQEEMACWRTAAWSLDAAVAALSPATPLLTLVPTPPPADAAVLAGELSQEEGLAAIAEVLELRKECEALAEQLGALREERDLLQDRLATAQDEWKAASTEVGRLTAEVARLTADAKAELLARWRSGR